MALINRVSRLFRADMHDILDHIEEPDALLRQSIREMETCLREDETNLNGLDHNRQLLEEQVTDLQQSLRNLESELALCLDTGNEQLARGLIKRKLESERIVKHILQKRKSAETSQSILRQRIKQNETRLKSLRQKTEIILRDVTSDTEPNMHSAANIDITDDEIEVALLREKQKRAES